MIYTHYGTGITFNGVNFYVGMRVHANQLSDYAGLYGIITEIRTEDDRETDNDSPDIYCRFDAPVLSMEVAVLEARFSYLHMKRMTLDDISLDMIVMAPEMLEPSINPNTLFHTSTVWAVVADWAVNDKGGHTETLYVNREDARAAFHLKLSAEVAEGCISLWSDREDYQLHDDEMSFECWLDGYYVGNHYKLTLEKKPLVEGPAAKGETK